MDNAANSKRISVIIPSWNLARLLPRALDSVYAQTLLPSEVIVVDDGSTDSTEEVVRPYVEKHGLVYLKKPNGGASSARNMGLDFCSGDYVAFLDSDDEWLPRHLEKMTDFLSRYSEAGLCFCDARHTTHGIPDEESINWSFRRKGFGVYLGRPRGWSGSIPGLEFYKANLWFGLIGSPSQVVARRQVFRSFRFDKSFDPVEDWSMWLQISKRWDICYLDEPLTIIHAQSSSLTMRPELKERFFENTIKTLQSELDVCADSVLRDEILDRIYVALEDEIYRSVRAMQIRRAGELGQRLRLTGWRPRPETPASVRIAVRVASLRGAVASLYRSWVKGA